MSIMEAFNIGKNALKAHGLRLDIHAKNIANMKSERITLIFSFLILIRKNMIHFIRYLSFINLDINLAISFSL